MKRSIARAELIAVVLESGFYKNTVAWSLQILGLNLKELQILHVSNPGEECR